ncbi:MAG: hypothetical protein F6K25_29560 [Okeania sp. SIO2G4]|uniref:hypothetical protein n=1 Tax=unclassified Okeania TaxID=2634635 RepID=UPI0013B8AEE4|nr:MULTISPECIES: hypothetical protein [unclassified Okeania]NEP75773.1 hypothetical protein [Okeania sp. SIO2G5]NEP96925.1 hypothetical protein [Okeania sp. SIO2F5]NEQ94565.1 hypothetical protein [Okeania sp. SIO2G4]
MKTRIFPFHFKVLFRDKSIAHGEKIIKKGETELEEICNKITQVSRMPVKESKLISSGSSAAVPMEVNVYVWGYRTPNRIFI